MTAPPDFSHGCHCGCGRRHATVTGEACADAWLFEGLNTLVDGFIETAAAGWSPDIWDMVAEGGPVWDAPIHTTSNEPCT